jgi:hypothetical protein
MMSDMFDPSDPFYYASLSALAFMFFGMAAFICPGHFGAAAGQLRKPQLITLTVWGDLPPKKWTFLTHRN